MQEITHRTRSVLAGLSLFGMLDSLYLYISHVSGTPLLCGALKGCDVVAASPYSELWGVPLSLLGVFFYAGMLVLAASLFSHHWKSVPWLLLTGSIVGALASAWFEYVQLALIGAWCLYCLFSAITTWAMACLMLVQVRRGPSGAPSPVER